MRAVMNPDVVCLKENDLAVDAMRVMCEKNLRQIPIIAEQGGVLVGLVTETDMMKLLKQVSGS